MLGTLRKFIVRRLIGSSSTSVMVGSFVAGDDTRSVALRLVDGYHETAARLSPAGARAVASQLNEWAAWAEKGQAQSQWQVFARYVAKTADEIAEPETAPAQ